MDSPHHQCELPGSLEEPIMVGMHDLKEGEITEEVEEFLSLKSYLETAQT